jgi:hypothetical protein
MTKCNEIKKGDKFGRLRIDERAANSKSGDARWSCYCECGNNVIATAYRLRHNRATQCRKCGHLAAGLKKSKGSGVVYEARVALGLTQKELAEYTGLTANGISEVEIEGRFFGLNGRGVDAQIKFNGAVPSRRQPRKSYRIRPDSNRRESVVTKTCHYCNEIVQQYTYSAKKYDMAFCSKSHQMLYRHRGPLNKTEAPITQAQPEPRKTRRKKRLEGELWKGMEQTLKESKGNQDAE